MVKVTAIGHQLLVQSIDRHPLKCCFIERPESLHVFRTVLIKTLQLCKILHVKHGAISFCHLVMSSPLAKDLDPASELFRKDVDHLNLRLRDE
jgi:hypothetical protein